MENSCIFVSRKTNYKTMDNVNPNRESLITSILEANGIKDTEKIRIAMRQFGNKSAEYEIESAKCPMIERNFKKKYIYDLHVKYDIMRRSWSISFSVDNNPMIINAIYEHLEMFNDPQQYNIYDFAIDVQHPVGTLTHAFSVEDNRFTLEIFKI